MTDPTTPACISGFILFFIGVVIIFRNRPNHPNITAIYDSGFFFIVIGTGLILWGVGVVVPPR